MSRQCPETLAYSGERNISVVRRALLGVITATFCSSVAQAEAGPSANPDLNEEQNVSQELANPVADLISVPFQNNFDYGGGQGGKSFRYTLVTQPVVPFHLNENWNLITRATIPFADVPRVFPNGPDEAIGLDGGPFANVQQVSRETGLADSALSFFLSPREPTSSGITWGFGPIIGLPTATNGFLGQRQWGAGPTGVLVRTSGPWLNALLVNHLWGLGDVTDNRKPLNTTFVQPVIAYTFPSATTVFLSSETTRDWSRDTWLVPIQLGGTQLVPIGGQLVQFGGILRYYAERPTGGPNWGFQLRVVLVFPK